MGLLTVFLIKTGSLFVIGFHYCVLIQKKEDMLGLIWPYSSHIEVITKKVI